MSLFVKLLFVIVQHTILMYHNLTKIAKCKTFEFILLLNALTLTDDGFVFRNVLGVSNNLALTQPSEKILTLLILTVHNHYGYQGDSKEVDLP